MMVGLSLAALVYATLSYSAKKIDKPYNKAIWLYVMIIAVGMLAGSSPLFANYGRAIWLKAGVPESEYAAK